VERTEKDSDCFRQDGPIKARTEDAGIKWRLSGQYLEKEMLRSFWSVPIYEAGEWWVKRSLQGLNWIGNCA